MLLSQSGLELGIRYLKLSNSYREAGDFEKSKEYLDKASKLVDSDKSWDYKYWKAVSYEYSGLLNKEQSEQASDSSEISFYAQKAVEDFNRALSEYNFLIEQKDGSPIPIQEIISSIKNLQNFMGSVSTNGNERVFNYERLKLRDLPRSLPQDLTNLTLAENKFTAIPSGLDRFTNLKHLNLSDNKIRSFSGELNDLIYLKWLDLSNNKIREIGDDVCNLKSLQELDLSNNKLKSLPACICQLQNLKILNLKGNKLPYPEIAKLIKCLPNTNIFIDSYILEENEKN